MMWSSKQAAIILKHDVESGGGDDQEAAASADAVTTTRSAERFLKILEAAAFSLLKGTTPCANRVAYLCKVYKV